MSTTADVPQIFIALFERSGNRHHHPAFLVSDDAKLHAAHDRQYPIYGIVREEVVGDDEAIYKQWRARHGSLSITNSALDGKPITVPFCAIALPPLVGQPMDVVQLWMESLSAEPWQSVSELSLDALRPESSPAETARWQQSSPQWSAMQWVLRAVDTLVAAGALPCRWQVKYPEPGVIDFKHPSWSQLLALAIEQRGNEAMALGPLVREIRVMEL